MAELRLDPHKPLREQPALGHNRWHPDIEPVITIEPGEELTLELRDSMDGQITPSSTAGELHDLITISHVLTGPVAVEGARPGDVLELEIVGYETSAFGWTIVRPDFGTLGHMATQPFLAKFELADGVARSDDLPGIAVKASTHAGVIGVAPSRALFEQALARETTLLEAGHPIRMPDASTAFPPSVADGLRTMPPRENAGNLDIRDLVGGAKLLLAVHVPGALLSAGDLHFVQGDGEVSLYGIECSGTITMRVNLRMQPRWVPAVAAYQAPPREPRAVFATTGIPVSGAGAHNAYLDLNLATVRALEEMVAWLGAEHGFTAEQAIAIASIAAELRISQCVDLPNALVSAALPLDLFEG